MNSKNISEKTTEVFSDPDLSSYRSDYIKELRENWSRNNDTQSRDLILLVLLAAIFELISRSAVGKISIGPIEVSDLPIIAKVLPIIIAYLYYDIAVLAAWHDLFSSANTALMSLAYPKAAEEDFDVLLHPRLHALAAPGLPVNSTLLKVVNAFLGLMILLGAIAFEIYAFYALFHRFGYTDIVVWASLSVSILLMSAALVMFLKD